MSVKAQVRQLEKKVENIFQDDNGPVFVLVIDVDAKSYCLIDGEKVYSGLEFERARLRWGQSKGPIRVVEDEPMSGVNEDLL